MDDYFIIDMWKNAVKSVFDKYLGFPISVKSTDDLTPTKLDEDHLLDDLKYTLHDIIETEKYYEFLGSIDYGYDEKIWNSKLKMCTCPAENFTLIGSGCTCGGV